MLRECLLATMCHMSGITCHVSCFMCHMSTIFICFITSDKVVGVVVGGSVINGAYTILFSTKYVLLHFENIILKQEKTCLEFIV